MEDYRISVVYLGHPRGSLGGPEHSLHWAWPLIVLEHRALLLEGACESGASKLHLNGGGFKGQF